MISLTLDTKFRKGHSRDKCASWSLQSDSITLFEVLCSTWLFFPDKLSADHAKLIQMNNFLSQANALSIELDLLDWIAQTASLLLRRQLVSKFLFSFYQTLDGMNKEVIDGGFYGHVSWSLSLFNVISINLSFYGLTIWSKT